MKISVYTFLLIICFLFFSCKNRKEEANNILMPDTTGLYQQQFTELFLDSFIIQNFISHHPESLADSSDLQEFYRMRNYRLAWISKEGISERAGHLLNMLRSAQEEMPGAWIQSVPLLQSLMDSIQSRNIVYSRNDSGLNELELLLSSGWFNFAEKMYGGVGEEKFKTLEWYIPRKKTEYPQLLDSLLKESKDSIFSLLPVFHMYADLKIYLEKYNRLLETEAWDSIPYPGSRVRSGERSDLIRSIRHRLFLLEDLAIDDSSGALDKDFEKAVQSFKGRMGLNSDELIDQSLIDALNVPLEFRIRTIMLNMERCRWIPVNSYEKFIVINLPEFRLHAFENGKMQWSCNVIVGQTGTHTVIFTGNLKYIVFSPYWNVPYSIFVNEMLPEIKKDVRYLQRHKMEIVSREFPVKIIDPSFIDWNLYPAVRFPYMLRQLPGPDNALGLVKFLFPNSFSMYLHDTPNKNLFKESRRDFSHGCIRVEEPLKLAEYLLSADTAYSRDSILNAMHSGKEKFVVLKENVPVIIVYFTAFVDNSGKLNFRDDIYEHDRKLEHVLFDTQGVHQD